MDSTITNITVDLSTSNNFGIVKAVQGDMHTRFAYITLLDNQVEYNLGNVYPVLRGTKPDGTTIFNVCTVSDDNKIIVELTGQILAEPGMSTYEIALYATPANLEEEKKVIASFPFSVIVSKAAFDPNVVTSTDEFTAIADVIGNNAFLKDCLDDIAASRDAAKDSEINAKASEVKARNSENNAKVSETNAKNSETASKASETNALNSEIAAKDSEAKAKTSETHAKDSETHAKTSEVNAKDSEIHAKTSETNAKNSETAAKTSETHAKTSENNAKNSETNAAVSANAAENNYLLSKSYAVGTDNITRPDDTTDNSKYYSEQSQQQASSAASSAAAAAASESIATAKAAESADSATLSRSWAVGDTNTREDETADNARYYSEQSKSYADSWKGSLLPQGTISFTQLPTSGNVAGHMYHIDHAFETDARFRDGAGYAYPAGTNVYWTADEKWDCLSGAFTMELTMAEYNALPEDVKMNGTIYYISDADNSISRATETTDGLMSSDDKKKLDEIESNIKAYSLPLAAESTRGGVKTGYVQNGKNYPVLLNADEQMYVNINLKPEDIGAPKNSECDCFGICNTAKTDGTKIVTVNGNFLLTPGSRVWVQFPNGSITNDSVYNHTPERLMLNVNNTGSKQVVVNGVRKSGGWKDPVIPENAVYEFVFDGTYWVLTDSLAAAARYSHATNGPIFTAFGSSGSYTKTHLVFSACGHSLYPTTRDLDSNPELANWSTNDGTLDYTGNISLGNTSNPWSGLYTLKAPSIVSDAKYKNNIENLTAPYMELFDCLQIRRYILNGGADTLTTTKNQRYHLGVIAQDVENAVKSVRLTSNDFGGVCSEYFAHYGSYVHTIHGGWRALADDKSYSDNVYNWKHRNDGAEPYEIYNEIMEEQITNLHIDSYRKNIGYIMIEDNSKLTKDQPPVTVNSISFVDFDGNITAVRFTDFLRYYTVDDADFENPLSDAIVNEDGSVTITFDRMYGCAWLKLSSVIDITRYQSVMIDMDYIGEYTLVFIPDGEYQNANPYDRDRNDQILYNYSFRYDELFNLTAYALQETRKEFHAYREETRKTIDCLAEKVDMLLRKVGD